MTCPNCNETIADDANACPACGRLHETLECERHPDRIAGGHCVICGTAVCEECNHPQSCHYVCEVHAAVPLESGWAQVYTTDDEVEAGLLKENLGADGVEARVLSQKDHFSFAVDLGDLSKVRVLVPAYDYEVARQLIEGHLEPSGEIAFACPNCGEAYEPEETACAACGTELLRQAEVPPPDLVAIRPRVEKSP